MPATSAWSGHVACDHRPGTDGREAPDVVAGDDDRAGADRGASSEADRAHDPVVGPRELAVRRDRAREPIVGEDRVRPDEDAVLDGHAVVDERSVLDLHAVADDHVLVDERVAADDALSADARPAPDLGAVPDARPRADGDVILDVGGRVQARGRIDHLASLLRMRMLGVEPDGPPCDAR